MEDYCSRCKNCSKDLDGTLRCKSMERMDSIITPNVTKGCEKWQLKWELGFKMPLLSENESEAK